MKYALVTGGSRGIGRAVSCKLAEMGYFILINYQSNDAEAEKTLQLVQEKGSNGEIMKFDVTDPAAIALALNNWASQHPDEYIEVLINNAGIRKDNLMLWMTGEEWNKVLDISLNGFFYVTQPLLKNMLVKRYCQYRILVRYSGNARTSQLFRSQRWRNSCYQSTGTRSGQEKGNSQRSSSGIYPHGYDGRD